MKVTLKMKPLPPFVGPHESCPEYSKTQEMVATAVVAVIVAVVLLMACVFLYTPYNSMAQWFRSF